MPKVHIIIPCYNESHRLPVAEIKLLAEQNDAFVILVNDGSTDDTQNVLQTLADTLNGQAEVLELKSNAGKGEAVRQGLCRAMDLDSEILGFVDADMATSVSDVQRLIKKLTDENLDAVFGSRVALLGHQIRRSPLRHYLGRIFATAASLILKLEIYDTQCGAKFFRNTSTLKMVLEKPFFSRWAFDVELIGRLSILGDPSKLREVPLQNWEDQGGSHLSIIAMMTTFVSLFAVRRHLARLRKQ